MGDWEVITKGNRKKLKSHKVKTACNPPKIFLSSFIDRIATAKSSMLRSDFIQQFSYALNSHKVQIIGIGLGNFSSSLYPCTQQALFEALSQEIGNGESELYDPAYSDDEILYLNSLGVKVNEGEFIRERNNFPLYIMIHCHFSLYELLLSQNWIQNKSFAIYGNPISSTHAKFSSETAIELSKNSRSITINTQDLAFNDTELSIFN
ncbi:unnamed protein product [Blepharisma stoltei]|uniref:SRR1-like domain-containing protein n=1 Tax=Blepharisma stoltei TaxID=1481888 RepID=A0AAU9KE64_9CILI|nr:unnamed protein product [Blepharisma stoltei]